MKKHCVFILVAAVLIFATMPALAQTAYTYSNEGFEQTGLWPTSASTTEKSVTATTGTWKIKNAFQKGSYPHAGTYELAINSSGYVITPQLSTGAGTLTLYARSTSTTARTLTIQKSTDGTTYSTITTKATGGSSYLLISLAINDASTRYIKIVEPSSGGAYFDDITVTSAGGSTVPVTGVSVAPTSASVAVAGTVQLTATISPSNATNKSVTWSSSSTSIATVSSSGLVTGVAAGSATITVRTADGGFTATSAITVTSTSVKVTGVTVAPTSASISVGGTTQLTATVSPSNATNKSVTWSSSSTSVATVNSSGLVSGVAAGSATITVRTADGGFTATSAITVTSTSVKVTGVSVVPTSATISVGGTTQLTATVAPSNATNKSVTWSSSNTGIATVNTTGLVTGVASGSATVTVRTADGGFTATSAITVNSVPPPSNGMIGYATVSGEGYTTTTGGNGGTATTVTNLTDLQNFVTACENNTTPRILYISGKISSSSSIVLTIKHGANLSIYGVGSSGELANIGLNIRDYDNVIVRNLKIHEVLYPNDALTIDECYHVWVDHNELYSKIGSGITVDTYDGLLDIKNGSRYVTVSWNYLHHHMKCSLIGHTDNSGQQATDSQMRITYHHNWFSYTDGRNPSLRFGALHMFNNYFEEITDYGLAARDGAHAKVENNHYNNVLLSMSTDKFPVSGLPNGYILQTGNLFTGTTGAPIISQTGADFWNSTTLPYSYTLDAAANVASIVKANCGVGKVAVPKESSDFAKSVAQRPAVFELMQNYPNPFNPSTTISFSLAQAGHVSLKVYDLLGREVATLVDGYREAGMQTPVVFDASKIASGMYLYRLQAGSNILVKKLMLVK